MPNPTLLQKAIAEKNSNNAQISMIDGKLGKNIGASERSSLTEIKILFAQSNAQILREIELLSGAPVVPDVIGLTQAAASTAITSAGYVVGTVTGTADPVASQSPIAGIHKGIGSTVDLTMTS